MTVINSRISIEVHYRTNERGVSVGSHHNGYDRTPGHDMSVEQTDALREFFQRERDVENGIWRSKIDPKWTAVHEKGYPTVQFRNDDGMREFSVYPNGSNLHAWSPELQRVGIEYLEAHPERKPWHDAKPGELWVVTLDGDEHGVSVETFEPGEDVFQVPDAESVSLSNPRISAARRIWPEDAS